MREDNFPLFISKISIRYNTLLSLSYTSLYGACMHAAAGLLSWSMELLAFASRLFSVCTQLLLTSVRLIHTSFLLYDFLVSERSGRKPPAERSALYVSLHCPRLQKMIVISDGASHKPKWDIYVMLYVMCDVSYCCTRSQKYTNVHYSTYVLTQKLGISPYSSQELAHEYASGFDKRQGGQTLTAIVIATVSAYSSQAYRIVKRLTSRHNRWPRSSQHASKYVGDCFVD